MGNQKNDFIINILSPNNIFMCFCKGRLTCDELFTPMCFHRSQLVYVSTR